MIGNYIALAMRTNSTVTGQNPAVTPDLLHATLGLCDEHFEYSMAKSWLNAVEELGDMCWFVALAAKELGCDPFANWEYHLARTPNAPLLMEAVAEFVSHVKKAYAYKAPLDIDHMRWLLHVIAARIAKIIEARSEFQPDELLAANIEKLKARFPEKFDVDMALTRDVKQEADAMRAVLQ